MKTKNVKITVTYTGFVPDTGRREVQLMTLFQQIVEVRHAETEESLCKLWITNIVEEGATE
jgi:ribosomal protein S15P/S13E